MTKYGPTGETLETETKTITAFYGRKVGLPGYSSEEASLHVQVAVEPTDDTGEIETKLIEAFAFAKTTVYNQLGMSSYVAASNVVHELGPVTGQPSLGVDGKPEAPKASIATGTASDDKDDLWRDLIDNPNNWFDNRATAKGNQPQFKGKRGTQFDGRGLWLNSAPAAIKEKLNGKVTA